MVDFYCCAEFQEYCIKEEFTPKEIVEITGFKVCPFRGHKIL